MIYLDTSVFLAWLLVEGRCPPETMWSESLVSSRLLEYEVFNRLHARNADPLYTNQARQLLGRVRLVELAPTVLSRALQPFSPPVRTLDALHLATMYFLCSQGQILSLASYDLRLTAAALTLRIESAQL